MKFFMFHLMPYRDLPEDFEEQHDSAWVGGRDYRLSPPPPAGPRPGSGGAKKIMGGAGPGGGRLVFGGDHNKLPNTTPPPTPRKKPPPPIWIPGVGSLETMDFVAKHR